MNRWFRSAYRWDTTWHRTHRGRVAVCGVLAHPAYPWADAVPAGRITCGACT